ncbi:hypothetical protein CEE37_12330 [candidate division LCP-89 bacterium B3_LCP]|uniref:Uncharacterized protein n=1 Tax=candidate division LCP-89 bacterium B3_LCP TaxID=2012998 RepID=A0A532UUB8_UNCL8|nr:MAG: hypothetical protein CEE37_12330 [candidate division LCP-89 bacterium B3_LCP]
MKFILTIISLHGVITLSGLTAFFWYIFIFKAESRSPLRLLIFPFAHFSQAFYTYNNPEVFPIMLGYVTFSCSLIQLFFPSSQLIYLFVWGTILAYEIFGVTTYVIRVSKIQFLIICIALTTILIGYGIIRTMQIENYQLMTRFDFIISIYLFIASVYILTRIIIKDSFTEDIEAFFVFFGLIIYSFLHLLAASILALGIVENFDYAFYATLITMLFWILVIPWIRYLKSKLS